MASSSTNTDSLQPQQEATKIKVHKKLLETGEYDKMKLFLRSKLTESGWFDEMNVLAQDRLSTQEKPDFEAVAESIEAQALGKCEGLRNDSVITRIFQYTSG